MSSSSTLELIKEERVKVSPQNRAWGEIPTRNHGVLTGFAEELAEGYILSCDLKERKSRGQFFTPPEIGLFNQGCRLLVLLS